MPLRIYPESWDPRGIRIGLQEHRRQQSKAFGWNKQPQVEACQAPILDHCRAILVTNAFE